MDTQLTADDSTSILDALPALTQICKLCTAAEIGLVLERLQAELDNERQRFDRWRPRRTVSAN